MSAGLYVCMCRGRGRERNDYSSLISHVTKIHVTQHDNSTLITSLQLYSIYTIEFAFLPFCDSLQYRNSYCKAIDNTTMPCATLDSCTFLIYYVLYLCSYSCTLDLHTAVTAQPRAKRTGGGRDGALRPRCSRAGRDGSVRLCSCAGREGSVRLCSCAGREGSLATFPSPPQR